MRNADTAKVKVERILNLMNGKNTKVAVVVFNEEDSWVGELAEQRGIVVIKDWRSKYGSPEEAAQSEAIMKYKLATINYTSVLSSLENADKWQPALNGIVRYVICGNNNVTINGILKLYKKLPEDLQQTLADSGITIQTIPRSQIIGEKFEPSQFNKNAITEIEQAA